MFTREMLLSEIDSMENEIISYRRTVHAFAETNGNEIRTSAFIQEKLTEFGIPFVKLRGTGVVGTLDTGKPGPHIGLRADIDALPMPEEPTNLKNPRVCISDTPDKTCHACGHDAHTAMLLGAAKILSAHKDDLCGIIYICFEQGEESGGGYGPMMEELAKHHIDTFWAIHVLNYLQAGTICVQPGPRMAGAAGIDITFVGKGGHGSRPDLSVNPVYCAANFMNNLAVAFANQIDANETVTLGITSIIGGGISNIIPDTARVLGSMRFFSQKEGAKASEILKEVALDTAKYNKCTVQFGAYVDRVGTPMINDKYYSDIITQRLTDVLGADAVVQSEPWYASESFSMYLKNWPGVMGHLGIRNEELGSGAEHHNSKFDIDEKCLRIGAIATIEYVLGVIENGVKPQ